MGDQPILSRSGLRWTYFGIFRAIADRLSPKHVPLYFQLTRAAVYKGETRPVVWEGYTLALREREMVLELRKIARQTGLPYSNIHRQYVGLKKDRLIRELKTRRGPGGGVIIKITAPDELPDLNQLRDRRLNQSLMELMKRNNWEKDPELIQQRINLNQSLDQLRKTLTTSLQLNFGFKKEESESIFGSEEVLKAINILNAGNADQIGNERKENCINSETGEVSGKGEQVLDRETPQDGAERERVMREFDEKIARQRDEANRRAK